MNLTFPLEVIWAMIGFIAVKIVDWIFRLRKKDKDLKDETIKRFEVAIDENSLALIKLRFSIEALEKSIASIPRIEKDVNEAHTKIRELKAGIGYNDTEDDDDNNEEKTGGNF